MLKRFLAVAASVLVLPAFASASQIGGFAGNLGGQLLTVTAYVGLIDRDVKIDTGGDEDFTSRQFSVKATYGFNDRVDLYARAGFADLQDLGGFDGALGNLMGAGGKFLILEGANNTRITINADVTLFTSEDSGVDADYQELAGAVVISKKAGNLTPFGGIESSHVEIDVDNAPDIEEEKSTGLFAGVDYFVNPNVYFTGEIHVFAENTLYMGVGYNF